jgi:hypothetical protein
MRGKYARPDESVLSRRTALGTIRKRELVPMVRERASEELPT